MKMYLCRIVVPNLLFLSIKPNSLGNHRIAPTAPNIERHFESEIKSKIENIFSGTLAQICTCTKIKANLQVLELPYYQDPLV